MNSLERNLRRWLRGDTAAASAVAQAVSRAYGTGDPAVALESAVAEALSGCRPSRRALLTRVRGGRGRLSERTYFRAKKEIVQRLAEVVARRTSAAPNGRPRRAKDASPIALPMVDRLIPEPIAAERYRGPDRGRALSAAALCSEMAGDQERADTLLAQAGENALNQFGQRDAASSFEVAQNRFFIARCRG